MHDLEICSYRGALNILSLIAKHLQFEVFQFLLFSKMFQKVWAFRCPWPVAQNPVATILEDWDPLLDTLVLRKGKAGLENPPKLIQ